MFTDTVFCSTVVSAASRFKSSPVFCASKKAISCFIRLPNSSPRSRATMRSPAFENCTKRTATDTPSTAKSSAMPSAA
jgi:hypothetical protein